MMFENFSSKGSVRKSIISDEILLLMADFCSQSSVGTKNLVILRRPTYSLANLKVFVPVITTHFSLI